jgi:hypothetical protein
VSTLRDAAKQVPDLADRLAPIIYEDAALIGVDIELQWRRYRAPVVSISIGRRRQNRVPRRGNSGTAGNCSRSGSQDGGKDPEGQ